MARFVQTKVLGVLAALALIGCGGAGPSGTPAADRLTAKAVLAPTEGNEVQGEVTFEQTDGEVVVRARVTGLKPGKHGFHIHEVGDCSAPDASSAGAHFNPHGTDHGAPGMPPHHIGDLGNLEANEAGIAEYEATLEFLSLKDGDPNLIVGRSVIVHADPDDLVSQPTGGAGARLACGVIER